MNCPWSFLLLKKPPPVFVLQQTGDGERGEERGGTKLTVKDHAAVAIAATI